MRRCLHGLRRPLQQTVSFLPSRLPGPPVHSRSHSVLLYTPSASHVPLPRKSFATVSTAAEAGTGRASFHYDALLSPASAALPIIKPQYDRTKLRKGIVHFGVGGFHRAHLAYYIDALLHLDGGDGEAYKWGICGVGVREQDRRISDAMKAQSCYYTLVTRGSREEQTELRIVGSMLDYLFAPDEPSAVLRQLLSQDTRIVSLTITESGYDVAHNPEVQHDIEHYGDYHSTVTSASGEQFDPAAGYPRSVFGWIVLGIDLRRQRELSPYTVCRATICSTTAP